MTFQTEKIEIIVKINVKIFLYDKTNLHNFLLKLSLAFHNNNSWKSVFMNALFLSIFCFIDFIPWRCDVLELQVTCTQVIFIWINVNLFRFFLTSQFVNMHLSEISHITNFLFFIHRTPPKLPDAPSYIEFAPLLKNFSTIDLNGDPTLTAGNCFL